MLVSCPRSRAMFFPDRTSCGIVVAAKPRLASSCASIAAAASSRPLRAPMQRTAGRLGGGLGALGLLELRGVLGRQIVDHADRVLGDLVDRRAVESAAQPILLGEAQGRHDHRVVEFLELRLLEVLVGDLGRLLGVVGQQALVELDLGRKRRLVAQQDVEESELGHVAPEHHQTDGKRRREQQARPAPTAWSRTPPRPAPRPGRARCSSRTARARGRCC